MGSSEKHRNAMLVITWVPEFWGKGVLQSNMLPGVGQIKNIYCIMLENTAKYIIFCQNDSLQAMCLNTAITQIVKGVNTACHKCAFCDFNTF